MTISAEQRARDMLERMGVPSAQSYSSGDLVELANLIAASPKMSVSAQEPKDSPLMLAWTAHKESEAYKNSLNWAAYSDHREGSLWALFSAGFRAATHTPATQPDEARRIVKMVLDDLEICTSECGPDWQSRELSTETVEALRAFQP